MRILMLDNYDSFTYNLVHMIRESGFGSSLKVFRNDKITLDEVNDFDKIMLSPGPGVPSEAGIMPELIRQYGDKKSIFGVCLGHQAIAEAYGAQLFNMPKVLHGVATSNLVTVADEILFRDIPTHFMVCRYHSWTVTPESIKSPLEITATDEKGNVMAIRHQQYDVRGVQFHPESILTEHGMQMVTNWLKN